jgi:hypothetical protein
MFFSLLIACNRPLPGKVGKGEISAEEEVKFESYDDFINKFLSNKEFQLSRTRFKDWSYIDFTDNELYCYTISDQLEMDSLDFEQVNSKKMFLTLLDTNGNNKSDFVFSKVNQVWYLVNHRSSEFNDSLSGLDKFIYGFCTDTTFCKEHIIYPLKYNYIGWVSYSDETVDTTEYLGREAVSTDLLLRNGRFMYTHNGSCDGAKNITIMARSEGFGMYMKFRRVNGDLFLFEIKEYNL